MKSPFYFLRLCGLVLLGFSTLNAEAKGCIGSVFVMFKAADGQLSVLAWYGPAEEEISVTLAEGDTVFISASFTGECFGFGHLGTVVRGTALGDTADYTSPIVNGYSHTGAKITQPGSYYAYPVGGDGGNVVLVFVYAAREPVDAGLLFTDHYTSLGLIAAGDTCTTPCVQASILPGHSIRLQPVYGSLAQEGGNVIVRHGGVGDSLDLTSPATVVPMTGFEGYQFSEAGVYLFTVEGPYFTSSAVAYVEVTELPPPPQVDMSLTIERADGTSEEVAYITPTDYSSNINIHLNPEDSVRIDHHVNTELNDPVMLKITQSPDWSPAYSSSPLVMDTLSTMAGTRMAGAGSYRLQLHVSSSSTPTSKTLLSINAPTPQLDLVVSVRHFDGSEEELYHSDSLMDPPPHLETALNPGDSIRVYSELTGYCGASGSIHIYRNLGLEDATFSDPQMTLPPGSPNDFSFSGSAHYLISMYGGDCSNGTAQLVNLHILPATPPTIDLIVNQVLTDGSSFPVVYAAAGNPPAFADLELATHDSIRVHSVLQQGSCTNLELKGYIAETDTATTADPVFIDSPLDSSGLAFHETGSLLLTLEDTCGAVTASAHLTVSSALATGIYTQTANGFNARYANGMLLVKAPSGGLLQVRNAAGQLLREVNMTKGTMPRSIPFRKEAGGIYIATLRGPSQVDFIRFAVY